MIDPSCVSAMVYLHEQLLTVSNSLASNIMYSTESWYTTSISCCRLFDGAALVEPFRYNASVSFILVNLTSRFCPHAFGVAFRETRRRRERCLTTVW